MEQLVITSNVAVWNRRKKAANWTHDLTNQSTRWLMCFSNARSNSMIHGHESFNESGCSCDISYARIVAILMDGL